MGRPSDMCMGCKYEVEDDLEGCLANSECSMTWPVQKLLERMDEDYESDWLISHPSEDCGTS